MDHVFSTTAALCAVALALPATSAFAQSIAPPPPLVLEYSLDGVVWDEDLARWSTGLIGIRATNSANPIVGAPDDEKTAGTWWTMFAYVHLAPGHPIQNPPSWLINSVPQGGDPLSNHFPYGHSPDQPNWYCTPALFDEWQAAVSAEGGAALPWLAIPTYLETLSSFVPDEWCTPTASPFWRSCFTADAMVNLDAVIHNAMIKQAAAAGVELGPDFFSGVGSTIYSEVYPYLVIELQAAGFRDTAIPLIEFFRGDESDPPPGPTFEDPPVVTLHEHSSVATAGFRPGAAGEYQEPEVVTGPFGSVPTLSFIGFVPGTVLFLRSVEQVPQLYQVPARFAAPGRIGVHLTMPAGKTYELYRVENVHGAWDLVGGERALFQVQ